MARHGVAAGGRRRRGATTVRLLGGILALSLALAVAVAGAVLYVFHAFGRDLPDYRQLADYEPPVMTRVHAGDGRLLCDDERLTHVCWSHAFYR